ncbi:MAG: DUF86 domain-containing protein [Candidatus Levyibacteriota bacterium]|nr:MAG: DUF86 domain-containing protein [Candidatus Levybacteria bacterium]
MKDDNFYIRQIFDSIGKIESFVNKFDKNKFLANQMAQSAVIMQLTLIGEISKKISEETKSKIDLPWKKIIGFRDRTVHDYFGINLNVVWDTIIIDLPQLKKALQKISE